MRINRLASLSLALGLLFAARPLVAQGPPAGSTGACGDGTYTSAKTKTGACSAHGGVKTWYGTPTAAPAPKPAAPPPAPPTPSTSGAKPADATGMCGDGSYTTAKNKSGACSSHGGVKVWYAAAPAPAPAPAPPPAPTPRASATQPAAPAVTPIPGAPAAATALCNDGTYSESQHRSGTCSNHKGVKQWLKVIPPK